MPLALFSLPFAPRPLPFALCPLPFALCSSPFALLTINVSAALLLVPLQAANALLTLSQNLVTQLVSIQGTSQAKLVNNLSTFAVGILSTQFPQLRRKPMTLKDVFENHKRPVDV